MARDRRGGFSHTPAFSFCVRLHGVYLKLLMYMYRIVPVVGVPPQFDELVFHILKRSGAGALGTARVWGDDQLAINVPIDLSRPPYNLERVGVPLVVPGDLSVLEV